MRVSSDPKPAACSSTRRSTPAFSVSITTRPFSRPAILRYQHGKDGFWLMFTWRFDSGEVAGSVTDLGDALALTGAQQAAIGFFCGNQFAAAGPAHYFLREQLWRDAPFHTSGRNVRSRPQPAAYRGAQSLRRRSRNRQSLPQGEIQDDFEIHRRELYQRSGTLQFSIYLQWHALGHAQELSSQPRLGLLGGALLSRVALPE